VGEPAAARASARSARVGLGREELDGHGAIELEVVAAQTSDMPPAPSRRVEAVPAAMTSVHGVAYVPS
jgi:hypothetical protein